MYRLVIFLLLTVPVFGQKSKPKKSWAQGTLYGYWGYNRTAFTKSDIRFVGYGYDFTLQNAKAHDRPAPLSKDYVNPSLITVPQFNARVGYMIRNNWGLSIGYDHLKYIFADGNEVLISGYIDEGIDEVTSLSGEYENEPFTTNEETFHYENSNGLNYLRLELSRIDPWYQTNNEKFTVSTTLGLSTGGLLSFNDFTFAGRKDMVTISMSGYALSAHAGLRLEFFRHVFLQGNLGGGFMHQLHVKTRPNDVSAYARHKYGYLERNVVLGFLLYLRPTNDCNSCPKW